MKVEGSAMKIFISHQKSDSILASRIATRLATLHSIPIYLDLIDSQIASSGESLGDHIKSRLDDCTHLLAVVSAATKESWWVPWEIGISTEKEQPIATYAGDSTTVPEYLKKWPYLRTDSDLDRYAAAAKQSDVTYRLQKSYKAESTARRQGTLDFYRIIRSALGQ
jgi:hypothetical protein